VAGNGTGKRNVPGQRRYLSMRTASRRSVQQ